MQLDADGVQVLRGAVSPEGVEALTEVVGGAFGDLAAPALREAAMAAAAGRSGALQQVGWAPHHPVLQRWLLHGGLGPIAADLLGCAQVQLLQDALMLKPAGAEGTIVWHQDHSYVGFFDVPRAASIRVALTVENEASGCLRVARGSHRWDVAGRHRAFTGRLADESETLSGDERAQLEAAEALVCLEPGDISIHTAFTWHRSLANTGPGPRLTVVLHVFDAACRLVRTRLPGTEVAARFPANADGTLDRAAFPIVR